MFFQIHSGLISRGSLHELAEASQTSPCWIHSGNLPLAVRPGMADEPACNPVPFGTPLNRSRRSASRTHRQRRWTLMPCSKETTSFATDSAPKVGQATSCAWHDAMSFPPRLHQPCSHDAHGRLLQSHQHASCIEPYILHRTDQARAHNPAQQLKKPDLTGCKRTFQKARRAVLCNVVQGCPDPGTGWPP